MIPTSSSWLNLGRAIVQVQGAHRSQAARAVSSSVPDLIDAIELWAEHWYDDPKPFIWHAEATRSSKRSAADEQPQASSVCRTVGGHGSDAADRPHTDAPRWEGCVSWQETNHLLVKGQ